MPYTPPVYYTPPSLGTYPSKLYPDYAGGHGFQFTTRDPKKELEYTSRLLSDILDPAGFWAEAELHVGTTLKTRYNDVVGTLNTNARATYDSILSQVKTDVYGGAPVTPNVAYDQFLAGMSASAGGGHSSVSAYSNLATQERQMQVHESAVNVAKTLMGLTYQGEWLRQMGIDTRMEALQRRNPRDKDKIRRQRDRLVEDSQMGTLFKVLGVCGRRWPFGVGFA